MKRNVSIILVIVMIMSLLAGCGGSTESAAPDDGPSEGVSGVTYSLGSVAAETSNQIEAARMFADKVNEYTNGAITINVFPASQLGSDESMCEDLSRGALEFSFLNQGSCAGFDQMLDVHYLPYIARDYDEADALFYGDGIIPTTLKETLASHGITVLGWYENEYRGLSNSLREVKTAADVSGMKLRVPGSEAIKGFFQALGAQCVTLTMGELYTALQQGTVDGQDNGVLITRDNMLDEVNNYFTYTKHVYAMSAIAVSDAIWQQFSPEQQEAVLKAAAETQEWQIQATRDQIDEYLAEMEAAGVQVHQLTDEEMATFTDIADQVWEDMKDIYGADLIETLREEVAAVRGEA